MYYNRILLFIISCFLISCQSKKDTKATEVIPIQYVSDKNPINISEIVKEIKYIPLETNKDILLGTIQHAYCYDKIYCLNSNKIDVFSLTGAFKYEINHAGERGPEGYKKIDFIYVNLEWRMIEIWDRQLRKIIQFDFENGDFIGTIPIACNAFQFIKNENQDYFFYNAGQPNPSLFKSTDLLYDILKFDQNGNYLEKYIKSDDRKRVLFYGYSILYNYKSSLYFSAPADNIVYKYEGDKFKQKYILDFGKYNIDSETFNQNKYWDVGDLLNSRFAWSTGRFREYKFGYTYEYLMKNQSYFGLLSKSTNKHLLATRTFKNDLDGGWNIGIQFVQDSLFVTSYDAFALKAYYNKLHDNLTGRVWEKFKVQHHSFSTCLEDLVDSDNPVIIIMTPKDF